MKFGQAIEALKVGEKVSREGWNGKGMYLILVPATPNVTPSYGTPYAKALGTETTTTIDAHIDMHTAKGTMQPGWVASQADMLSEDWSVVSK